MANNLPLLLELTKREILAKYRGSFIGILWPVLIPIIMLAVYGFVFSIVLKVKWNQEVGVQGEFAVILFAGLILHAFLSECITRSPSVIFENPNYVKKVVFPLHILSPVIVGNAFIHLLLSFVILLLAVLYVYGNLHATLLLTPIVIMPIVIMSLGVSWILASLGVFIKDIVQLMSLLSTVLLFLSPIFFPIERMPDLVQKLIYLNPLSLPVEQVRQLIWGQMPDWQNTAIYCGISIFIAILGYWWFQKTRRAFADVI